MCKYNYQCTYIYEKLFYYKFFYIGQFIINRKLTANRSFILSSIIHSDQYILRFIKITDIDFDDALLFHIIKFNNLYKITDHIYA